MCITLTITSEKIVVNNREEKRTVGLLSAAKKKPKNLEPLSPVLYSEQEDNFNTVTVNTENK